MEYSKAGFVKYSNRLFPKWCSKQWTVWITSRKGKSFRTYKEAVIFSKLLDIEDLIKEGNNSGNGEK